MTEPRRRGKADPLKKLRKAALKTIREKGEQIAEKLLELTLEGDITCAKFLIALIENAPPRPRGPGSFKASQRSGPRSRNGWTHSTIPTTRRPGLSPKTTWKILLRNLPMIPPDCAHSAWNMKRTPIDRHLG